MIVLQKSTNNIVSEITGGENLTLDEAINLVDLHIIEDDSDTAPGYYYDDLIYTTEDEALYKLFEAAAAGRDIVTDGTMEELRDIYNHADSMSSIDFIEFADTVADREK